MKTKTTTPTSKIAIPDRLFFRIGDVAQILGVKPHVLRYWQSEFSVVSPQKSGSGQRVYRRGDVETLAMIKRLLHEERYSLEGARLRIRELRKEGELNAFKRGILAETLAAAAPATLPAELPPELPPEPQIDLEALRLAATTLQGLLGRPLTDFFNY